MKSTSGQLLVPSQLPTVKGSAAKLVKEAFDVRVLTGSAAKLVKEAFDVRVLTGSTLGIEVSEVVDGVRLVEGGCSIFAGTGATAPDPSQQ